MNFRRESLGPDALLTEQAAVQAEKNRNRTIDWYSEVIFMNSSSRLSPVSEFLGQYANPHNTDLSMTLQGMQEDFEQPIHWTDMCSGYGVALRQAAADPNLAGIQTTGVDLFKLDIETLSEDHLKLLERLTPGSTSPTAAPRQIIGNAETVQLPDKPHIITLIEGIQYFENPLQGLANCYNQLADHGIAIIANQDEYWSEGVQYAPLDDHHYQEEDTPLPHVFNELTRSGIAYQYAHRADDRLTGRPKLAPWNVRSLVLQKKPGTLLRVVADVVQIDVSPYEQYKRTRYQSPQTFDSPIQVVSD
jgi:hypothetical protein